MKFVFSFASLSAVPHLRSWRSLRRSKFNILAQVDALLIDADCLTCAYISIIDRLLPTPCLQPTNLRGATLVTDLQDQDTHSSSSRDPPDSDCPCIDGGGFYSKEACNAIEGCDWFQRKCIPTIKDADCDGGRNGMGGDALRSTFQF